MSLQNLSGAAIDQIVTTPPHESSLQARRWDRVQDVVNDVCDRLGKLCDVDCGLDDDHGEVVHDWSLSFETRGDDAATELTTKLLELLAAAGGAGEYRIPCHVGKKRYRIRVEEVAQ